MGTPPTGGSEMEKFLRSVEDSRIDIFSSQYESFFVLSVNVRADGETMQLECGGTGLIPFLTCPAHKISLSQVRRSRAALTTEREKGNCAEREHAKKKRCKRVGVRGEEYRLRFVLEAFVSIVGRFVFTSCAGEAVQSRVGRVQGREGVWRVPSGQNEMRSLPAVRGGVCIPQVSP